MIKKRSSYIIPPSFYKRTVVAKEKKQEEIPVVKKELKSPVTPITEQVKSDAGKHITATKEETPKLKTRRRSTSSALSLKSLKRQKEDKQVAEQSKDYSNMPKKAFSKAEFDVYWAKYISILNRQGDKMLGSILNTSKPVLKDTVIHLVYPNTMMAEELNKQQTKVLNYLREKLQNYQIKFNIVVDEKEEKTYAYTPQEKYVKLVEINPMIEEMRKMLFLDI